MFWVWTRVVGFTNSMEWLTVWCCATGRRCWTWLYAAHWSLHMFDPGRTYCWMIGRRVAASWLATTVITPSAGVWLVSTIMIPNTQISLLGGRPLWYCVDNNVWLLNHYINPCFYYNIMWLSYLGLVTKLWFESRHQGLPPLGVSPEGGASNCRPRCRDGWHRQCIITSHVWKESFDFPKKNFQLSNS